MRNNCDGLVPVIMQQTVLYSTSASSASLNNMGNDTGR